MTWGKGSRFSVLPRSSSPPCFQSEENPPLTPTDESPGSRHASLALTCVWAGSPALQESALQPEGEAGGGRPGPYSHGSYLQEGGLGRPGPGAPPGSHGYASSARRPGSPADRPGSAAAASSGSRLGTRFQGRRR